LRGVSGGAVVADFEDGKPTLVQCPATNGGSYPLSIAFETAEPIRCPRTAG